MRGILSSSAATVFVGALFVAGGAAANPQGVPVPESPPLTCTTVATYDGSFTVTALQGPTGEFPTAALCNGLACFDYGYRISSTTMSVDTTAFSVSRTQDLNPRTNTPLVGTVSVFPPGQGAGGYEESRGFLADAVHEYVVRFNNSYLPSVDAHIFINGFSAARIGTVLVRSGGKRSQPCLIATPGVATDKFQPVTQSRHQTAAGGQCEFDRDANGAITNLTPGCHFVQVDPAALVVNGQPLRNNTNDDGITFASPSCQPGVNNVGCTTTCYGPPRPSRPVCVCSPFSTSCP